MSARLNRSIGTIVVWCTGCLGWSAIADDVDAGHDIAVGHEKAVHPGTRQAYMNRAKHRERRRKLQDTQL